MKGTRKWMAPAMALMALCAATMLSGCFPDDTYGKLNLSETALFDQAKEAGPVFAPTDSSSAIVQGSRAAITAYDNSPLVHIYNIMREYVDSRDAGKIDQSNIYSAMWQLSAYISKSSSGDADKAYATPTEVPATIALSMPAGTYTRGGTTTSTPATGQTRTESWAMAKDGDLVSILYAYLVEFASPQSAVPGVVQANYDPASGDIEFDLCYTVDYIEASSMSAAGEIYSPRVWLKGNALTHAFQIKGITYGGNVNTAAENYFSYAATGVAQGTGEYMLFHVYWSQTDGTVIECYYKVPAGATEADLQALYTSYPDGMTLAEVTAADTKDYIADLPATLFGPADAGRRTTDYDNGNVLTPLPTQP
jgi:hypothetical protein